MKHIKLFSDLHFEFANHLTSHIESISDSYKDTMLILAGDIDTNGRDIPFIERMCGQYKYVIKINGNHEYYGADFNRVVEKFVDFELNGPKNFHFMNNDIRYIDDVRIIGGTMWTSFANENPIVMYDASRIMNDYNEITVDGHYLTPEFILEQHKLFINTLENELEKPFDGKTIVVTHHTPDSQNTLYNEFYHADKLELINSHPEINYWFFGHSHTTIDKVVNKTRLMSNPYGYHNHATNKVFNKYFLINI